MEDEPLLLLFPPVDLALGLGQLFVGSVVGDGEKVLQKKKIRNKLKRWKRWRWWRRWGRWRRWRTWRALL